MRSRVPLIFSLLMLLCAGSALAQTTSGSIAGNITDPNHAAIAGATVKVVDAAKGFTLTATTDGEGRFVFPQVSPGTYTMTIEATGFKKLERTGIVLVANDKLTLGDITVQVGATSETVTITAEATLIQAESAERSYAIQGEVVQNIAVNGRSFVPLASIATGVVFHDNSAANAGASDEIADVSANGLRTSANNMQLDGVAIVDTGNNGTMIGVNLDAIAEFKVLTSNYQAEYGRAAGAQISAVTKSGTSDFHGSFYTFRRHDGMNANTWINNRDSTPTNPINKPRRDQRDIGYTIGGPVYIPNLFNKNKDKFFFFFSQEHQKRFNPPSGPVRVRVPTALERAGDFSESIDASGQLANLIRDPDSGSPCTAADTSGCFRDGGVLGRIPAGRLNPAGLAILNMYPLPNATGQDFNYISQEGTNAPQRQDLYRGDWVINNNWRANGKFLYNKNSPTQPYGSFVLQSSLPEFATNFPNNRYSVSGTVTGSLSPTTVLEVTFGQSHNSIDILPANDQFNRTDLGLTGVRVLYPDAVQLDLPPRFCWGNGVPGFNSCGGGRLTNTPAIGTNNAPFYNFNTTRDWSASVSKIWRSHNLKFGFFWQNSFKPQSSFATNNGQYDFSDNASNPLDTGFAFANAAIGVYNTFQQASDYVIGEYRYNNVEWYVQDNWKVTSRLTLDYGIRFNWIQPQFDEQLQTGNFLPDQYNAANAPLLYRPVCIGVNPCSTEDRLADRRAVDPRLLVPGFVPTMANTIESVYIGRLVPNTGSLTNGVFQAGQGIPDGTYDNRGIHLGPRFGFAYDVRGNQSLVVRGGGGVFYDRPQGNTVFDLVQNPPTTLQPTLFYGLMDSIDPQNVLLAPPALVAFDLQGKVPTSYAYNLGIQYKLPLDSVLDVSYVGTKASHLLRRRNINAPAYGAAYQTENQDPTLAASSIPGATSLPVDFLRPFPGFGNISYIEPAASSNYHSLQTSLNRRFQGGLLLGVNYTWSKALGTQSDDLPGINGFGAPRIDGNERRANYGPLDFDRRHSFNINWVYELPRFTHSKGAGYALNNWQLSGIYRYQTGSPYNINFTIPGLGANSLTGTETIEGARIALVGDPGSGHSSDPYRQFNVAAFTTPQPGSIGLESGRNFLYRSPINSLDLALSKEFRFKENVKLEIRLDAFNALNHTQFNDVSTRLTVSDLNNPTPTNLADPNNRSLFTGFGAVTSVRPAREMQLSARFQF